MSEHKKKIWIQAFRQAALFILVSVIAALAVNQFRPGGISIIGDWSAEARFSDADGDLMIVSFEEARELFINQQVIFIDARSEKQYLEGHIQGAVSLPWQRVDDYFIEVADRLDTGKPIITYCDGETCDLSHELAIFLKEMGFQNPRVLVNGWSLWLQAGLPISTGSDTDER